jgi:ubiquitin
MNMQDPIDLHQMMLNEAPRYVTVPFSEIPNAKDSVTNKKKKFEEKSIKSDANVKESVKSKSSDSNPDEDGYYLISVNGSKLFSETKSLTGIQIKRKIGVREQDSLWIVSDEQDILVNNIQSIDLKTYEKAEFYTGKCKNGPNVGDIAETKKPQHPGRTPGRKTTPRTITVNGKAMTWGKSRITGMDIKRMVPAAITKPHHYEVYQTFTRKDSKPVGDGTMITLWVNQKFAFDVREIGGGHD